MLNFQVSLGFFSKIIVATFLSLIATSSLSATIEQETLAHLDQIRAIKADADKETVKLYNRQMDEAWNFFYANEALALPVLRSELSHELKKENPNNLILLDIGFFIRGQKGSLDQALGKQALLRLDPASKIVRQNQNQLFHFAYDVALDRDISMLPFLDNAFLRNKVSAIIPQHSLVLDETMVCVFLYGLYGQNGESHLKSLLNKPELAQKIIEVLTWIGSPNSVPEVKSAMLTNRVYATFVRATSYMMKVGGPEGRAIMLAINPQEFDAGSQDYYGKIRKDIEAASFGSLQKRFTRSAVSATLSDEALKERLAAMHANYGIDNETEPESIVNSSLPRQFLISELTGIRERMFYRLSNEALSDVKITNAILNTLYYKDQ